MAEEVDAVGVAMADVSMGGQAPGGGEVEERDPDVERRVALALSVAEETVTEDGLRLLFSKLKDRRPRCYDGFEPSGRMHIAQGIMKSVNVNKLTEAGCDFVFWVADWFAQLNNKMDGDLKKIQVVGNYFIEVWKACGMNMDHVQFLWASEEINRRPDEYWMKVMDIARRNNLARVIRCSQIMGRNEQDDLSAAQIFYPCMQCADIFFLKADICQLGMDQRKVNMLAREYCDAMKPKIKNKPIILSHHMLPGLKQGQEKMSKSDPESAIFMEDSKKDVASKIKKAYCPPEIVEGNPCLEYVQYLVIPKLGKFELKRSDANGGDKTYTSIEAVHADYRSGTVHPGDLKASLTDAINEMLQPVRDHFENNPEAKALMDKVRKYRVSK
ncbi:Tyrosine--tRNA ligase 1, cytoplasmic [Porphyridium purpureum]|uniref:tyrosine--tRNA ligase n=1 Tax=Porphyridium purpureum TaxID=35688 RepID=A0A5J4Z2Q2_PORPP|nr:Tyrosine--tRNA ligase 1, cytoplasmic [Porphyridium purpureum]|eukprot:POR6408..scf295_1